VERGPFPVERLRSIEQRLAGGRPETVVTTFPPRSGVPEPGAFAELARALADVDRAGAADGRDGAGRAADRADGPDDLVRRRWVYGRASRRPDLEPLLLPAVAQEPDLRTAVGVALEALHRGTAVDPAVWGEAVPAPGRARVRERARDVATRLRCSPEDAVVTAEEVATWSHWLQDRLVRRTASRDVLRRVEAHGRDVRIRAHARERLGGPARPAPRADEYTDAPLLVRQAAALVLVTRWRTEVGLHDPEVDALLDHLGAGPGRTPGAPLTPGTAGADALVAALGGELPGRLRARAEGRAVPADVLHATLVDLVEVSHGSRRTAVDAVGSQQHLRDLEARLAPWELVLPPRADLDDPPSTTGPATRGTPRPAQLALWRALAEQPRRLGPR
jgi:hypothetical protein